MNQADAAQIAIHLHDCDAGFIPHLSERLNILDFSWKIVELAIRFEAWSAGRLIGLVAVYCNDVERRAAFITNVSVVPEWQGKSIARELLESSFEYINGLAFGRIELEVDRRNATAFSMYERLGFLVEKADVNSVVMYAEIGRNV